MSSIATLNGQQYIIPAYNDTGWAQGAGNLSLYLAAIAASTLQPTGGSFTLTADVDFGANFGLKALFLKTETANPASAGVIRLASADTIKWRNNANGADVSLSKDSSDNLLWATNKVYTAGGAAGIVNADIASGAAIAYSKLALTGAILNADLAGSIAYSKLSLTGAILNADLAGSIAYSKLTLTGAILNADINASAAIALSKLAALGTAKAVQTNSSTGFLEASSVTNTELGYVSGVTSAIQTQINAIAQKYFQTVQATSATDDATTSSTFANTSLAASITPSSSAHRVKVTVTGTIFVNASGKNGDVTIKRGSTNLGGTNGFVTSKTTSSGLSQMPVSISYIDSPSATTSTTYTVAIASRDNTTDVEWNGQNNLLSTIILEEIV